MRFRLDIAYDGSNFHGWAAQPQLRTVEGVITAALTRITRQNIKLTCAGRTDAGVHARAQVAHFDVDPSDSADSSIISGRLNRMLAQDITIWSCQHVSDDFDARFSAQERRYVYRICDDRSRWDPIRRKDATLIHLKGTAASLDIAEMNKAAEFLIGEHDFAAFCKKREGATTIRRLLELSSLRNQELVETTIRADAFCHSMVRALMGALVAVGQHRFEPQWAGQILSAQVRDPRVKVMAAQGLTLEGVAYPPEYELAARATTNRRRRDEDFHV